MDTIVRTGPNYEMGPRGKRQSFDIKKKWTKTIQPVFSFEDQKYKKKKQLNKRNSSFLKTEESKKKK